MSCPHRPSLRRVLPGVRTAHSILCREGYFSECALPTSVVLSVAQRAPRISVLSARHFLKQSIGLPAKLLGEVLGSFWQWMSLHAALCLAVTLIFQFEIMKPPTESGAKVKWHIWVWTFIYPFFNFQKLSFILHLKTTKHFLRFV